MKNRLQRNSPSISKNRKPVTVEEIDLLIDQLHDLCTQLVTEHPTCGDQCPIPSDRHGAPLHTGTPVTFEKVCVCKNYPRWFAKSSNCVTVNVTQTWNENVFFSSHFLRQDVWYLYFSSERGMLCMLTYAENCEWNLSPLSQYHKHQETVLDAYKSVHGLYT